MTNPNNSVGTNGAFGGRTSVNAFNDDLASYSAGILSGWACEPDSGLTVVLGGDGNTRDVAIAEDNAGNKTTINNISGSPISVTVGAAPNTNSRIDSIVAYVNNPPTGSDTATDNYGACGLIVVEGTASATPSAPNESTIRTTITADGASGTTAYYVVLANITIASGTTDLTSDDISAGDNALISASNIDFTTLLPAGITFRITDGSNSGYADNHTDGWYGYNFTSGTAAGACTRYNGNYTSNGIGGGAQLSNGAPKGLYLVTVEINNNGEGSADGYRPFRIQKNNEVLTGDVGTSYRGGSGSATVLVELEPNDIINLQIYQQNTKRSVVARVWIRGYFLRPSN